MVFSPNNYDKFCMGKQVCSKFQCTLHFRERTFKNKTKNTQQQILEACNWREPSHLAAGPSLVGLILAYISLEKTITMTLETCAQNGICQSSFKQRCTLGTWKDRSQRHWKQGLSGMTKPWCRTSVEGWHGGIYANGSQSGQGTCCQTPPAVRRQTH